MSHFINSEIVLQEAFKFLIILFEIDYIGGLNLF